MQGMQEQRGGEIDGLKIRPESGTHFLLIWALSVRTLLFMLPRRCAASEISCCFVECGSLNNLFLCHLHFVIFGDLLPLSNRGTGAACFQIAVAQSQFRIQLLTRAFPNPKSRYILLRERG